MMHTRRSIVVLCAFVLCGSVAVNGQFVNRFVDVFDPGSDKLISLAFDGDNAALVAYRKGYTIRVGRVVDTGYAFDTLPGYPSESFVNLEVTAYNEWWMTIGPKDVFEFAAKSDWFDWTYQVGTIEGTAVRTALSDNDLLHVAAIDGGHVYHLWFDVKSNRWLRHPVGLWSGYAAPPPSIDTHAGKVLLSCRDFHTNSANRIVVKENDNYTALPDFETQPLYFQAAFDANSRSTVVYIASGKLVYAVYIDGIGWVKSPTSLACDAVLGFDHSSDGMPAAVFVNDGTLYYADNAEGIWTAVLVDADYIDNSYYEFRFDRDDRPVVAYGAYDTGLGRSVLRLAGTHIRPHNIADLNGDGVVNYHDFARFAAQWKRFANPELDTLEADFNRDGLVNIDDLRFFAANWLWQAEP